MGAGGMVAVSMAVVRCFYGTTKNRVLALVQAMAVIAPMVAPVIGAFCCSLSAGAVPSGS
ncbi:MAG: hypothetical protein ACLR2G_13195 [Phascolarctobacterium faecium]